MNALSGGEKLKAYLANLSQEVTKAAEVRVGLLEDSTYPDGTSVPMVAAIQEFGAPSKGIPPRPYFRTMIAEKADSWGEATAKLLPQNDFDAAKTLGQVGMGIKGQLQKSIIDVTSPPLSPVTLLLRERFGNNPDEITFDDVLQARFSIANGRKPQVTGTQAKPLVWTGHMLNSVDYEVRG